MAQQRKPLEAIFAEQQPPAAARPSMDEIFAQQQGSPAPPPDLSSQSVLGGVSSWLQKHVQPKMEAFASRLASTPDASVMDAPDLDAMLQRVGRPLAANVVQTLAHPVDNAPEILGLLASTVPATRAIGALRMLGGAAPVVGRTLQTAAGGGVGGFIKEGPEGIIPNAAMQGGAQLVGEGLVGGTGFLAKKGGRSAGYHALNPTDADKAAIWLAEKGTPEGFSPGRAEDLIRDVFLDRGAGTPGGDTYFQSLATKTDAGTSAINDILTRSRSPEGLPMYPYAVDLSQSTRGVADLADTLARRGGTNPLKASKAATQAADNFLARAPETTPFATPTNRMLTEGTLEVPALGGRPYGEPPAQGTGALRTIRRDPLPRAGGPPGHQTPQLGEAPAYAPVDYGTQGTMQVPVAQLREQVAALKASNPELAMEIEALLPQGGMVSSRIVPLDAALESLRNVDKDLLRTRQQRMGALGKAQDYVPSPAERAQQIIRGNLRQDINDAAPLASDGRTLADVNEELSRDIVWRDLASRATGNDVSGMRGRTGFDPHTGRPRLSVYENLARFGGVAARPLVRGGEAAMAGAADSVTLARLVALLMANEPDRVDPTVSGVNVSGIGGGR